MGQICHKYDHLLTFAAEDILCYFLIFVKYSKTFGFNIVCFLARCFWLWFFGLQNSQSSPSGMLSAGILIVSLPRFHIAVISYLPSDLSSLKSMRPLPAGYGR